MWPPARKRHFDEGSGPARAAGQRRGLNLRRLEIPRLEKRAALRHIGAVAPPRARGGGDVAERLKATVC